MYTISNNKNNLIEINKSKFIGFLIKVDSLEDIKTNLDKIKKEYNDATHICYAYKLDGMEKAFDDGEPSGTAGKPILELLKKNDLDHVISIVVRYFGGIKLGAGGLLRAYVNTINELIKDEKLKELVEAYKVKFEISYDKVNLLPKENINILYKEFDMNIIYEVITSKENIEQLKKLSSKFEILNKVKTSF